MGKKKLRKIALSGGPGGGKTTAADLFRREIGERVVIVPESATLLFSGGFPRGVEAPGLLEASQKAIYHIQKNLEIAQSAIYPDRILLCDRGSIDGAAYWPGDTNDFFQHLGTSLDEELDEYDAVLFFESAAVGGLQIEGGNPTRIENLEEAIKLDQKLRSLWSQHPNFFLVPHNKSFFKKITFALAMLENLVTQFEHNNNQQPK